MSNSTLNSLGYSLNQPLTSIFPIPIKAKRAPTTGDIGYQIGQIWVFNSAAYILVLVASGVATWNLLESGGGAGVFASLTVTPGPISLTGTTSINTAGAGVTTIGTGGTGAVNIGNATGNTSVTGSLATSTTLTAGTGLTVTTGNAVVSAGNITATLGNIAASAGSVSAGTSITATLGNITATNGNVVLSTAATKLVLPGPVNIMSGAGAPAGGLAVNVGDLYINTTASTATTRLYIATSAGNWTFFTADA